MADYEEDDLDILTSLMDAEDDEDDPDDKPPVFSYQVRPGKETTPDKSSKEATNSTTSMAEETVPSQSGDDKTKTELSTRCIKEEGEEEGDTIDFDDDENLDELTALLDAENAETTKTTETAPSISQASTSISQASLSDTVASVKEDRKPTPDKGDHDKSKDELLEELMKMRAEMDQLKKQSSPESQAVTKNAAPKSQPKEMFSDAIAPCKTESSKQLKPGISKSKDSHRSSSQRKGDEKSKQSGTSDNGIASKKKYKMDGAAATKLFHSSSEDDHLQGVESSESEEEGEDDSTISTLAVNKQQNEEHIFTKNKTRVAHTPSNQNVKSKNGSSPSYKCCLCSKTFGDYHTFKMHKLSHSNNPAHICSICNKKFTSKNQMDMHMRSHGEAAAAQHQKAQSASLAPNRTSGLSKGRSQMPSSGYKSGHSSAGRSTVGVSKTIGDELCEVENYSQIRIINPIISSTGMKDKMSGRKFIRLSIMDKYVSSNGGDIEGDWATMGVIISKVPPKTSNKGKLFSIWKINDLRNLEKSVSVFLFGKVHETHWKSPEGSVVGILNGNIMPKREQGHPDEVSMTVDHPQKMLIMGKSKDFGFCKGKKKNGNPCTMVVNVGECEYCQYHVQSEYKKTSSKRSDLQSSFSGTAPKGPRFNGKLKGEFSYQGQSFNCSNTKMKITAQKRKDKQAVATKIGSSKACEQMVEDMRKGVIMMHGRGNEEVDTVVSISGASKQFKELLSKPSPGTQNLMRHMVQVEVKEKSDIKAISASELIKKQKTDFQKQRQAAQASLPRLGRGMEDSGDFFTSKKSKSTMNPNLAKSKALQMLEKKGPLTKQDPNCVGGKDKRKDMSERRKELVRRRAEVDWGTNSESTAGSSSESSEEPTKKKPKLFLGEEVNMTKEQMTALINAKSAHAGELAEIEAEWQDKYFSALEKKESLENKMSSIMQKTCRVVSCKQCKYTWFAPSKLCQERNHDLKRHEAQQRFYTCQTCTTRTITFDRIPTKPCRSCGSDNYGRSSMLKERKGPQLESEKLLIRGEERKWVNS